MSEQTVSCPQCSAQLNVGAPGRYRCPACGTEFHHAGGPAVTSAAQAPPPAYQVMFTPTKPQPSPFERRAELGFFTGLFGTFKQTLVNPVGFFRGLEPTGPVGGALLYAVIFGTIGYFFGILWALLQNMLLGGAMGLGAAPPGMPDMGALNMFQDPSFMRNYFLVLLIGTPILGPLGVLCNMFVTAAVLHLFLMIYRGRGQDFWATLRVCCYSGGVMVFQAVPFVGGMIAMIWAIVLWIIGLKEVHRTSYGKSAGAVLTPGALLLLLCCGVMVLAVFGVAAMSL